MQFRGSLEKQCKSDLELFILIAFDSKYGKDVVNNNLPIQKIRTETNMHNIIIESVNNKLADNMNTINGEEDICIDKIIPNIVNLDDAQLKKCIHVKEHQD